jgi:hypothetical protein
MKDGLVTAQMQIPASNFRPHRFHRLVGDCGTEIDEVLPESIHRSPSPKSVAQKIELLVSVRTPPIIILAINDLRLCRMKLCSPHSPNPASAEPNGSGYAGLGCEPLKAAM